MVNGPGKNVGPVGCWLLHRARWEAIQQLTECHDLNHVLKGHAGRGSETRLRARTEEGRTARRLLPVDGDLASLGKKNRSSA